MPKALLVQVSALVEQATSLSQTCVIDPWCSAEIGWQRPDFDHSRTGEHDGLTCGLCAQRIGGKMVTAATSLKSGSFFGLVAVVRSSCASFRGRSFGAFGSYISTMANSSQIGVLVRRAFVDAMAQQASEEDGALRRPRSMAPSGASLKRSSVANVQAPAQTLRSWCASTRSCRATCDALTARHRRSLPPERRRCFRRLREGVVTARASRSRGPIPTNMHGWRPR